jgi:hypothetical protein
MAVRAITMVIVTSVVDHVSMIEHGRRRVLLMHGREPTAAVGSFR